MSLSEALTAIDTVCRSLHAEALLATVSEGLSQDPYMAARARFEPTTFRSKGVVSTNAPPGPTMYCLYMYVPCRILLEISAYIFLYIHTWIYATIACILVK